MFQKASYSKTNNKSIFSFILKKSTATINFRVRRETRSSLYVASHDCIAASRACLCCAPRMSSRPQRNTPIHQHCSVLVQTAKVTCSLSYFSLYASLHHSCYSLEAVCAGSPRHSCLFLLPFSLVSLRISSASHNALFISPARASVQFEKKNC